MIPYRPRLCKNRLKRQFSLNCQPENDIIIAAHNYNDHFGHIGDLDSGDEMIFTDTDGISHHYEVDFTQYVDGYDVDAMYRGESNDWDITLFTCTLSGQSRVTVRGLRVENEEN